METDRWPDCGACSARRRYAPPWSSRRVAAIGRAALSAWSRPRPMCCPARSPAASGRPTSPTKACTGQRTRCTLSTRSSFPYRTPHVVASTSPARSNQAAHPTFPTRRSRWRSGSDFLPAGLRGYASAPLSARMAGGISRPGNPPSPRRYDLFRFWPRRNHVPQMSSERRGSPLSASIGTADSHPRRAAIAPVARGTCV